MPVSLQKAEEGHDLSFSMLDEKDLSPINYKKVNCKIGQEVPWRQVIEAAFELKELLEDLDLKSFVKLTGSKEIHVHVPIAPLYDWDQIKSFTQILSMEMVARNPSLHVANMSKKLRKKKIFVEHLRNGHGATAVVPYSLRAKPLSALALPLE